VECIVEVVHILDKGVTSEVITDRRFLGREWKLRFPVLTGKSGNARMGAAEYISWNLEDIDSFEFRLCNSTRSRSMALLTGTGTLQSVRGICDRDGEHIGRA
jgi:hypothetical protein